MLNLWSLCRDIIIANESNTLLIKGEKVNKLILLFRFG